MREVSVRGGAGPATALEAAGALALGAATGLRFAAAPAFALMALLTGVDNAGPSFVCSVGGIGPALSGMTLMYALMSLVHAAPWLTAMSRRGSRA